MRDEIELREAGVAPPASALLAGGAARRCATPSRKSAARLAALSEGRAPKAKITAEERERKKQSAEALAAPCAKCHVFAKAAFTPHGPRPPRARALHLRSTART